MAADRFPQDVRYTEEHEWIRLQGDRGAVGITWFAQDQLGDVVFVELPEVGARIEKGEPFGVVESVKTVSDLYAPVTGEVLELNERLEDEPELVNDDPYGDGWMLAVRVGDAAGAEDLLDAAAYRRMVEGED